MAVPNTTTFTMANVKTEIQSNGGGTTNSLVQAFSNANDDGFDPAYEGSKNSLLNFRNYEHITAPSELIVSPTSVSVGLSGGSGNFTVTSNESWSVSQITGGALWSISPSSGSGNGSFTITAPSGGEVVYQFLVETTSGDELDVFIAMERAG
jgi:hypothetical protein